MIKDGIQQMKMKIDILGHVTERAKHLKLKVFITY